MAVLDQSVACFRYFEDLAAIPHGSHNEHAASNWVVRFARERGLNVYQEPCGNVIIKVDATPGYEDAPAVMLSCHLDMVCEKTPDSSHDFMKDPLDLYVEDGWLKANGTTLGADDGCGVAMILAVLERTDLKHPRLECVFTTTEETGMNGAQELDVNQLEARRMICLDATGERIVLTTCAGGCRVTLRKKIHRRPVRGGGLRISVRGLQGGHSGMFMTAGRGNAIKLLGRFLSALDREDIPYELVCIEGGSKDNAIPGFAEASFLCEHRVEAKHVLEDTYALIREELLPVEDQWSLDVEEVELNNPMEDGDAGSLVHLLRLLPDGVSVMSRRVPDLPQTSNNLGVFTTEENMIEISTSVRSAGESEMEELTERISVIGQLCGAEVEINGKYPGMPFIPESPFRRQYAEILQEIWQTEPHYLAIHAGSEVGYFVKRIPGLEVVTLGPIMEDVHSPRERLNIASFKKCTEFLMQALERMN